MNKIIKKITYWMKANEDFVERKIALSLFDLLGFKQNIVLWAFRAYSNNNHFLKAFADRVPCKVISDVTREDCFCALIPTLQSNMQLLELITAMDVQTEWTYIPLVANFDELLFNWKAIMAKGAVEYNFSMMEAVFDADSRLSFKFDAKYFESHKIDDILKNWEKTFGDIKFTKKLLN